MPVTLAFAIAAALKAGCVLIGKELMKRFGDTEDTARASRLMIKDQHLGLQETLEESPTCALVPYVPREIALSSSSRALAILTNSLALRSQFDVLESNLFSVMNSFKLFAAWYRARCIAVVKSALRSVISHMKVRISFFGSVSESNMKEVASVSFLIQVNFSRLMAQVIVVLKEVTRLLKSRTEENMSTFLGQISPDGIGGKRGCFDLLNSNSVGDSIPVNCTQKCLAMAMTFVKQALTIFSESFIGALLQLHATKVMTLVSLLCISISLIGWNIPLMIFDGSKLDQCLLQQPIISEAAAGLEAGLFNSVTSPSMSLPVGTSNSLNLIGSISSFNGLRSVSVDTGAIDRQVDWNHIGLVEYTPSLHSLANDFSTATPESELQTGYLGNDEAIAVSLVNWNIDASRFIQSRSDLGSTLASSLLINVLALDYASNGIASKHFDGYSVSATTDEAFVTRNISQAPQSSVELELCPPSNAVDGDSSIKSMMMIIAVVPPEELSKISYLSREFDGYSDSMHVEDQYSSSSTAVQVHEALTDLDQPGFIAIAYNHRDLLLYVWSDNDFIAASLSGRHTTSSFLDHDAAPALPLDGNIGAIHCIQSESSQFVHTPGGLSSDGNATSQFSSDSLALGLGHSFPRNTSGGDTSSVQMIVPELGPSQELSTIHCQGQEFERSSAQDVMNVYPQLRLLSAQLVRTNSVEKTKSSAPMNRSKRFFVAAQSSLFSALNEYSIFCEIRQLALLLLMLAYHNSDGTANEPDDVALSSGSGMPSGANLDLGLEETSHDEVISAGGENAEDTALPLNTNIKPSRRELMALRSELGSHWSSPSKRRCRRRRSSRTRSRPQYFEPVWASFKENKQS